MLGRAARLMTSQGYHFCDIRDICETLKIIFNSKNWLSLTLTFPLSLKLDLIDLLAERHRSKNIIFNYQLSIFNSIMVPVPVNVPV